MAPRPATDPNRWKQVSGGRSIRRKPQKSNMQKAMGMLPFGKKATPGKSKSKSKSGSRGGTAGKAAMLTAAAGFAFKNRDKISGMLGKRRSGAQTTPQPPQPKAPLV
jgi:hypothetical protein